LALVLAELISEPGELPACQWRARWFCRGRCGTRRRH